MRHLILYLLLLGVSSLPLFAQVEVPRVDASVEVRVIELEAVVVDRKGNPIRGLTSRDFELLENGLPREITNLSEFRTDASPSDSASGVVAEAVATPKPRQIVIFFDTLSTDTFSRQRAAKALAPFLETVEKSDEVMIVTWNRKLQVVVPPTSDRMALLAGLQTVPRELSRAPVRANWMASQAEIVPGFSPVGEGSTSVGDRMTEFIQGSDSVGTARVLRALVSRLAGAGGRKILFVISDGLMLDSSLSREFAGGTASAGRTTDNRRETDRGMLAEIARDANAVGVTFYTMQPLGLVTTSSVTDEDGATSDAGLFNSGAATQRLDRISIGASSLISLAAQTGGRFITNTNDLGAGMGRVGRDLSNYYSIAYTAGPSVNDLERKVELRVKNRDLIVRTRRSVLDRSPDTEFAQQLVSNFLFPVSSNDLNISLRVENSARLARRRFRIPVDVIIPYSKMAFVSEKGGYVAELSVYIASSDTETNVSEVRRYDRKVKISRSDFAGLATKRYVYGMDVDLESRTASNRLTVGVIDQLSKINGFAVLEIPAPPKASKK